MDNMWHRVIKGKYIRNLGVENWIRLSKKSVKGASNILYGITKSFNILVKWLACMPGDGDFIHVGLDSSVGELDIFKLSSGLVESLNMSGKKCLKDFIRNKGSDIFGSE